MLKNLNYNISNTIQNRIGVDRRNATIPIFRDINFNIEDVSTVYCIAGSFNEANYFLMLHNSIYGYRHRIKYIFTPEQLSGILINNIWIYGTAWRQDQYNRLISVVHHRGIEILDGRRLDTSMDID